MKKSVIATIVTGLLITSAVIPNVSVAKENDKPLAKNVIVMISDGCGYNQIAATDYYQYGKIGSQVYEKFPFQSGMSTYSTGSYNPESAWNSFNYVNSAPTDSAAAATAMSTGVKTYDAAIGVDNDGNPLKHISEYFEEQGKSTGVITSVEFSHATPAGFVAHNVSRNNYQALANEMIVSSKTDVIMGAGNPFFDDDGKKLNTAKSYQYVGGQSTWEGLVNETLTVADADGDGTPDPWKLIQTKDEFQTLQTGVTPQRVIGVPQVYTTLQQNRGGDKQADAFKVAFNENVPDLSEMTEGALNVLDNNENGFFLMIEGGAIDWAGHANQGGRVIEEEADFNKAVEAVNEWVKKNSNWGETLLIVTGDHETGYLTGPDSDPDWTSIINNGAGNMPGMEWHSTNHTNSLIPLFAKGDSARLLMDYADQTDPVRGTYLDNTEIAKLIQEVIRIK